MHLRFIENKSKGPHTSTIKMKQKTYSIYTLLCIGFSLLFSACDFEPVRLAEPNERIRPIAAFLKNNYDYSLFAAALSYTELEDELNQAGPYTVFAPTNRAFNELGINRAEDIFRLPKDSLRKVIRYHIVPRRLNVYDDVPMSTINSEFKSIDGDKLYISRDRFASNYSQLRVNGVNIEKRNLENSNGLIQSIDAVLKYVPLKLHEYVDKEERFSLFSAALKKFGLWEQLKTTEQLTLIAPNNKAFEKAGVTMNDIKNINPTKYSPRFFAPYIFPVRFFLEDFRLYASSGDGYYAGAPLKRFVPGDEAYTYGISSASYSFFIKLSKYNDGPAIRTISINQRTKKDFLLQDAILHETETLLMYPSEALLP